MRHIKIALYTTLTVVSLAGCSGIKENLGLNRQVPDEFYVLKHAPLVMPPDHTLSPPTPGAARPQEQNPDEQAKTILFGQDAQTQNTKSKAEQKLLQQAGAQNKQEDIRQTIDKEADEYNDSESPVVQKLLNIGKEGQAPSTVVNATEEAKRIKENLENSAPITEGETPSVTVY